MKTNSRIFATVFCMCVIITVQYCAAFQAVIAEGPVVEKSNPLLTELAGAQFIEYTADEMKDELDGKLVGLYFTASWCGPCRSFTPKLIKLRDANPDVIQFVMVSQDDSIEAQKGYLKKTKMNVPAIRFDDPLSEEFTARYGANAIPMLVFFDSNGKLLTRFGQECMTQTLQPGALDALGDSEGAKAFQKLVAPFQEELQAERQELVKNIPAVVEKYQDFPRIKEIAGWIGYFGGSSSTERLMREIGKEMAADWDNQKHHLDYLPKLATELKPKSNGFIGILEIQSGVLFEELGKAAVKNPEILDTLNRFSADGGLSGSQCSRGKEWGMAGLVTAGVAGNDEAMEQVIDWKTALGGSSHAPLKIYPCLYPACHAGNERALEMAKQIYENDPYYVYKAFAAFVPAALKGNETAIEALGLIAAEEDRNGYHKHAVRFLKEATAKGHEKAQEVLDDLPHAEENEASE